MPNYTKEVVGIIGGCGVAAANEFVRRLERRLMELDCSDDFCHPETILYQATQAPNRIAFAAGTSKISFAPHFIDIGKKLKACGATLCCIPCNTAHCVIGEIEAAVGIPFINIVTETLLFMEKAHPSAERIGILGSSGTNHARIFQTHAEKLGQGYEFLFPGDNLQRIVDGGIAAVKSGLHYVSPSDARNFFSDAMYDLVSQGADAIVLGCTEIPLAVVEGEYAGRPLVDTISVLVKACIEACRVD
jgi:aspartate racemase